MKKVLIGAPIDDQKLYCWEEFKNGLIRFGRELGHDILLVDTSNNKSMENKIKNEGFFYRNVWKEKAMDRVVAARNIIRTKGLKGYADYKYSHVLMLDADAILNCDVVDILKKQDVPVISALLNTIDDNNMPAPVPLIENNDGTLTNMSLDSIGTGIQQVHRIGFGCVLIKTDVFEKIRIRCKRKHGKLMIGEDYCFSDDARGLDYILWVDTDLQIPHKIAGQWRWDEA